MTRPADDPTYVKGLEESLKKFLKPVRGIRLEIAVRALTGFKVLPWNASDPHCRAIRERLARGLTRAYSELQQSGISSQRPNEVGNYVEAPVKAALETQGFSARVPDARGGGRQYAGYPDILLELEGHPATYLECKTYNARNVASSQRSFYCSPPLAKITRDAYHLLVAFEMERRDSKFFPVAYRLLSLEGLPLDVKHEFNSDNRTLYSACTTILKEPR